MVGIKASRLDSSSPVASAPISKQAKQTRGSFGAEINSIEGPAVLSLVKALPAVNMSSRTRSDSSTNPHGLLALAVPLVPRVSSPLGVHQVG
ncbi:hypothetical protein Nepgr_022289 [Nepenthes gracilis]|uniref:Uncharacterized protein n=1 Tax=Nepenthes gracilis TaxID=150966 RepID=A0AAD3SYG1_NEPGR|nr:hypothetical protein Nepgr_022289 [Nepenthes gracilis]